MPTDAEKLAELRTLPFIEVVELVKVSWGAPDGDVYYTSTLDPHLFRDCPIDADLIELRLPGREFQDILNDTHIADDTVKLKLWDGDGAISDLANTHGAGQRVEMYYWFPQVALLLSQWFGHLQPVTEAGIEWFEVNAEVGFMSSMLTLPRRALYNTCSALFGGWLQTQSEIDEGDCPYSRHLAGTPGAGSFVTDTSWKCTANIPIGDWQALGFDDSGWGAAVDEGPLNTWPWNTVGTPPPFPSGSTAHWIWNVNSLPNWQGPFSVVYFRKTFTAAGAQALLTLSADERFTAWVNGVAVSSGGTWHQSFSALLTLEEGEDYVIAVRVENEGIGGLVGQLSYGIQGVGIGNLDPSTGQPFTDCPRNRAACIARLGDDLNYLGFDTVIQSYTVGQTKGPNINVTTRGNESNLKRPLRVIAGKRHVQDLDLLAYTVEPDTRHPEGGFVSCLFEIGEGPIKSQANQTVAGQVIAAAHLNARNGEPRQARTGFSASASNYSNTALFFARAGPGDFTKTTADELRGECDVEGSRDVRRYTDELSYVEEYSTDRAWWLLHCMRNKRWGYGLDVARVVLQDWIDLAKWGQEIVSFTDKDGTHYTGPRTSFNAELIDRTAQQQINDICMAGRYTLPYRDQGKIRIRPLGRARELFSPTQLTETAFAGALGREPDETELDDWVDALNAALATSYAALLAEAQDHIKDLFESDEYDDRARTDEEFIYDLYAAWLNRVPESQDAVNAWLARVTAAGRPAVLDPGFSDSLEFASRINASDIEVPTFRDSGPSRNICVDEQNRTTLIRQIQSDADLPNRVIVNFDDSAHGNAERPLVFEDIDAQLRAGRAFGDTTRRAVEKQYALLGVTDVGEATRLGNLFLHLGPFDDGGTKNNFRVQFTAWFSDCLTLRKYDLIKVESATLTRYGFSYFRVRSLRRLPDLKVEVSAQAYPVGYYDSLESVFVPPPIMGVGGDPNPGGDRTIPPWHVGILSPSHVADRVSFTIGHQALTL